ncbi:formate dehydrogenase accessory protein FdhE [Neomegalonema sp.]|uniref:formate dehydrogenase accessory protein FdhE n=1 Tax=Neomegalonema sp. TaxID=2039713 RepID=UPI0026304BCE|nr:formate dehydrogenase accessory protein FdhE [Neomegalonema sp.]MDD2870172.1 formate dehydrogenase accessory protein FdhE [Neomegalonema sp.]
MTNTPQPDPSMIGGVPEPPFVLPLDPAKLFETRAKRFAFLAQHDATLAPYLTFLAELTGLQAKLLASLPPVAPIPPEKARQAREFSMPPIERASLAEDPVLVATFVALIEAAADLEMPDAARQALSAVWAADEEDRRWLLSNILADHVPEGAAAPHLFAAAAVQIHMARLAAGLAPKSLTPVGVGICPACGGRPATSSVVGGQEIDNLRYAACACCATRWNEVRVKCLCCGSTKGISYRSAATHEATVKAEACAECGSWVKILHQVKNPSLDPVADDVGSLGLDVLMKDSGATRGGFNPYLAGY